MSNTIYTSISTHDIKQVHKVGGTNKANRVVRVLGKREAIESKFMGLAFKSNRAEAQRNERRAKRK